jgi:hypothetical protein
MFGKRPAKALDSWRTSKLDFRDVRFFMYACHPPPPQETSLCRVRRTLESSELSTNSERQFCPSTSFQKDLEWYRLLWKWLKRTSTVSDVSKSAEQLGSESVSSYQLRALVDTAVPTRKRLHYRLASEALWSVERQEVIDWTRNTVK